jgi:hypothetical protein
MQRFDKGAERARLQNRLFKAKKEVVSFEFVLP